MTTPPLDAHTLAIVSFALRSLQDAHGLIAVPTPAAPLTADRDQAMTVQFHECRSVWDLAVQRHFADTPHVLLTDFWRFLQEALRARATSLTPARPTPDARPLAAIHGRIHALLEVERTLRSIVGDALDPQ